MTGAAKGHARGRKRGVPIFFEPDQVERTNDWLRRNDGMSFSEAVRTLVEWGLEADG